MSKCGNPHCSRSVGNHGETTVGYGLKDHNCYWQFPCRVCAEDFDNRKGEILDSIRQELLFQEYLPLQIAEYLADQTWLQLPAWPRADQDVQKLIENSKQYYDLLALEAEAETIQ